MYILYLKWFSEKNWRMNWLCYEYADVALSWGPGYIGQKSLSLLTYDHSMRWKFTFIDIGNIDCKCVNDIKLKILLP